MTVRTKICGITRLEDAQAALECGADALGFNFYPKSPRYLDLETARELAAGLSPFGLRVGVFVDAGFEEIMEAVKSMRLGTVQLHGEEPPEIAEDLRGEGLRVWKAIRMRDADSVKPFLDYPCDAYVLDAFDPKTAGGTGRPFDWDLLEDWRPEKPWILSGGLTPENVVEAIQQLHPDGVDVASGVESAPGVKDFDLLRTFLSRARQELVPA